MWHLHLMRMFCFEAETPNMLKQLDEDTLYPEDARFEYHVEHQTSRLRTRDFIQSLQTYAHYLGYITTATFHVLVHSSPINYIFPRELIVYILICRQRRNKLQCKQTGEWRTLQ